MKFPGEARGLFGVAMVVPIADGTPGAVMLKKKPRHCQRKSTLLGLTIPRHHDCDDAYLRLDRCADAVHDALDEVILDIEQVDEFLGQSSTSAEELEEVEEMMDSLNFAEDYSAV